MGTKQWKHIYVAGPYRASTPWLIEQNIRRAEELALDVWRLNDPLRLNDPNMDLCREDIGVVAVCPHTMTRYYQQSAPDSVWLEGLLSLVERCDAVVLVPGWQRSEGTIGEIARAISLGIPVFSSIQDLARGLLADARAKCPCPVADQCAPCVIGRVRGASGAVGNVLLGSGTGAL